MRRLFLLPATVMFCAAGFAACGDDQSSAFDTLPPIFTTTTTTTTTTTPDSRRKFYEVKSGDNVADIARSFEVPVAEIVKLNRLENGGGLLQVGQILEIPTDVVLVEELPIPSSTDAP